jgi:hypothetical protein
MAFVLSFAAGRPIGSSSGTKVTAKVAFAFYLTAARWESEFVSEIKQENRPGSGLFAWRGTRARARARVNSA